MQVDLADPRTQRAIIIAANAGQWLKCRLADGVLVFGIPSQSQPNLYYLADYEDCNCPDFRRYGLSDSRRGTYGEHRFCKHVLAVRMHTELARTARQKQARRPAVRPLRQIIPLEEHRRLARLRREQEEWAF